METLHLRMEKHSANALELARWLEAQPAVERVFYRGWPVIRSMSWRCASKAAAARWCPSWSRGRAEAWRVVDRVQLISRTANLGDVKSTITHPASTTHARITPEAR